jgi:hypothetical protein
MTLLTRIFGSKPKTPTPQVAQLSLKSIEVIIEYRDAHAEVCEFTLSFPYKNEAEKYLMNNKARDILQGMQEDLDEPSKKSEHVIIGDDLLIRKKDFVSAYIIGDE